METKIYRIIPAGSFWHAEENLTKKAVLRGPLKRDLVIRTVELAKREKPSMVIIYKEDGSVEEERNFYQYS